MAKKNSPPPKPSYHGPEAEKVDAYEIKERGETPSRIARILKETSLKNAILLSEILKRPYE